MRVLFAGAILACALVAAEAIAKDPLPASKAPPATVRTVIACRSLTDSAQRLACFDQSVRNLETAVAGQELVMFSAREIKEARRSLFGFSVPKLPFFGDQDEEVEHQSTITGSRALGYGKWQIRLEDGAWWETTEATRNMEAPMNGSKIRIRRGALGNHFMSIGGIGTVRGRRIS
ncbi:MAG: hypothetical protein ABIN83_04685 [Sphingomicrobium sp.]